MNESGVTLEALEGRSAGGYRAVSKSETVTYPQTMQAAFPDKERVVETKAKLVEAGVKYVMSCWIDIMGQPKTKPVPIGEFEAICYGKGPQFAVHSVSMVPELGPADSDQIPIPDLDSLVICPWDRTCAWVFADLAPGDPGGRGRLLADGRCRARVHHPALCRRPAGQGLRQRSDPARRRPAEAPGLGL
jgi:hypothetical protein